MHGMYGERINKMEWSVRNHHPIDFRYNVKHFGADVAKRMEIVDTDHFGSLCQRLCVHFQSFQDKDATRGFVSSRSLHISVGMR